MAKTKTEPEVHDYTRERCGWGHDRTFDSKDGGRTAHMMGWGYGLKKGDFILLSMQSGKTAKYLIKKVEYYSDPRDMWSADVVFYAYLAPVGASREG